MNLKRPTRFNFYDWSDLDLRAMRLTALFLSLVCLALAVVATLRRLRKKVVSEMDLDRALRV